MADVLLLSDIWENFKTVCYNVYKLDVSYYYTSPGLSWDAFLKHTDDYYMKTYTPSVRKYKVLRPKTTCPKI